MTNQDTPTIWADMTPEEKGALLLAKHEGNNIQRSYSGAWETVHQPFFHGLAYRVKPEPKRETMTLYGRGHVWVASFQCALYDTHRITFDTIDGEPDCTTICMERLT